MTLILLSLASYGILIFINVVFSITEHVRTRGIASTNTVESNHCGKCKNYKLENILSQTKLA